MRETNDYKRERPLMTTIAQAFHLDAVTQRSWRPTSTRPTPVHLYHDANHGSYRIISVEGSKPVVNATVTSTVVLNKASSKFLQWMDYRTNAVYGLGFTTDGELDKFMEKVIEVQKMLNQTEANVSSNDSNHVPEQDDYLSGSGSTSDETLKMENQRLKAALVESSTNAKKWERELLSLRETNRKLTEALNKAKQSGETTQSLMKVLNTMATGSNAQLSGNSAAELVQNLEMLIVQNKTIQEDLGDMLSWRQEAATLHQQIGDKLRELLHLHEELSSKLM